MIRKHTVSSNHSEFCLASYKAWRTNIIMRIKDAETGITQSRYKDKTCID